MMRANKNFMFPGFGRRQVAEGSVVTNQVINALKISGLSDSEIGRLVEGYAAETPKKRRSPKKSQKVEPPAESDIREED